jgi:group I intron endonuclease
MTPYRLILNELQDSIENTSGIYMILCLENDKCYIGQTNKMKRRWGEHLDKLRCGKHFNTYLQNIFSKYGENSLVFFLLKSCPVEELNKYEQEYVLTLDKKYLLNLVDVGNGYTKSEETKKKMSLWQKGIKKDPEQIKRMNEARKNSIGWSFWKGRKHTEESKKKISEKKKEFYKNNPQKISAEHFAALVRGRKAKPVTNEVKQYFSKLYKGKKFSEEDRLRRTAKQQETRQRNLLLKMQNKKELENVATS